jgi:hypothetical protein
MEKVAIAVLLTTAKAQEQTKEKAKAAMSGDAVHVVRSK